MKLIHKSILCLFCLGSGIALAQKATKPADLRVVLPNVQFAKEKSALRPDATRELDEVVALLKKSPGVTLDIGVHTDASGSASYNLRLSQQRAQAVSGYLTKKGIAAKRVKVRGYGETNPINRCRRGVRCSEAEKRENRRVELRISGLPADLELQKQWLALGGMAPVQPAVPAIAKMPGPTVPVFTSGLAASGDPVPPARGGATERGIDYFPELSDAGKHVPNPLPNTFAGYTVEIVCTEKPLAAGHAILRKYDPVFLRQDGGGQYCYYIGAFHTLPEAQQFLRKEALPQFPKAQVALFYNDIKKYQPN